MNDLDRIEEKRLALQAMLDDGKTSEDRNRMGQFATPTLLAREILAHGVRLLPPETPIKFTDPGIGTGSFYSALRKAVPEKQIERAAGFEVDSYYGSLPVNSGPVRRLKSIWTILPRLSQESWEKQIFLYAIRRTFGTTTSTRKQRPVCNVAQKRHAA